MIRDKAVTGSYVTKRELINCLKANFHANPTYWWIHCFLLCRADEVREAVVAPGEPPRLRVPRRYPDQYMGIHNGADLRIRIAQSPNVTKETFLEYARDAMVPTVEAIRDLQGCQARPPMIFCNNCFCHCSHDILQELAHRGILLLTYPSHTSYIFWLLDVMLFGRLKSAKEFLPGNQELDPQVDHTKLVFRAWKIATTRTRIRGS
jgi:hypothetical protein